jgi:hypothetical protein
MILSSWSDEAGLPGKTQMQKHANRTPNALRRQFMGGSFRSFGRVTKICANQHNFFLFNFLSYPHGCFSTGFFTASVENCEFLRDTTVISGGRGHSTTRIGP